jgi:hypothetical protein
MQLAFQCVTESLSPGVKRPGREAHRLPLSSAEVENACSYSLFISSAFATYVHNRTSIEMKDTGLKFS